MTDDRVLRLPETPFDAAEGIGAETTRAILTFGKTEAEVAGIDRELAEEGEIQILPIVLPPLPVEKYSVTQPRHPAGSPRGGEFAPTRVTFSSAQANVESRALEREYKEYMRGLDTKTILALQHYTGGGFRSINRYLRRGEAEYSPERIRRRIEYLDEAVGMNSPIEFVAMRGMKDKELYDRIASGEDLVGLEFTDAGFGSFTFHEGTARTFVGDRVAHERILVRARFPRGTICAYPQGAASSHNETEVVIARNARYRIVNVTKSPDGNRAAELEIELEDQW